MCLPIVGRYSRRPWSCEFQDIRFICSFLPPLEKHPERAMFSRLIFQKECELPRVTGQNRRNQEQPFWVTMHGFESSYKKSLHCSYKKHLQCKCVNTLYFGHTRLITAQNSPVSGRPDGTWKSNPFSRVNGEHVVWVAFYAFLQRDA